MYKSPIRNDAVKSIQSTLYTGYSIKKHLFWGFAVCFFFIKVPSVSGMNNGWTLFQMRSSKRTERILIAGNADKDDGKQNPPVRWRCRPVSDGDPIGEEFPASEPDPLKGKPCKTQPDKLKPHGVEQKVLPLWRRRRFFGVDLGMYSSFGLMGLEFLFKVMPVLEIRWARPEGSRIRSADRVLRIGLRFDTGMYGSYYDDDGSSGKTALMLGPEVGFRMYRPGDKDSGNVRLLHGPFLGVQYLLYRTYHRNGDLEKGSGHFFNVRAGYELGMVLSRRFQIMLFLGYEKFFNFFSGLNFGYTF